MSEPRRVTRRALLAASLLGVVPARAEASAFRTFEVSAPVGRVARRALVMVPARSAPRELPLLVLLHGLGETRSQDAGVRAWIDPYGLGDAWQMLASASLPAVGPREVSEGSWAAHARLSREEPFLGACVVCPFMPNPYVGSAADPRLEAYADWLCTGLLPALRARVPELSKDRAHMGIAGVSLGGVAAIEVSLRRPQAFGLVGTVQGAFSVERAKGYARELASASGREPPILYVATSRFDPYRAANQLLAREAPSEGVPTVSCSRGGAHSQDWLRKIGSVDLLAFADRALRRDAAKRPFGFEPCSEG